MLTNNVDLVGMSHTSFEDLMWIHSDVWNLVPSPAWWDVERLKKLRDGYFHGTCKNHQEGISFDLTTEDKQLCNYDVNQLIIFYGDVINQVGITLSFIGF